MKRTKNTILFRIVNHRFFYLLLTQLFMLLLLSTAQATETSWPIQFGTGKEVVAVFEPQFERIDDGQISARAAFSVKADGLPLKFGAIRYHASTREKGRDVLFSQIEVDDIQYPGASRRRLNALKSTLQERFGARGFVLAQSRFDAALNELRSPTSYANDAPTIYVEESPAVLVYIDGDPVIEEVKSGYLKYVINTAYFIVLNPDDNHYYLKGGKWWYRTRNLGKPFTPTGSVPKSIKKLADSAFSGDGKDKDNTLNKLENPPKVIVTTSPAELIVINGPPKLAPIEGTGLLYVDNTENDILLEIASQQYYVLLAGRWYRSNALDSNEWTHVPPNELPADFTDIPEDAGMANVLASVSGTEAAETAVLSNTIPEVAAVDRRSATAKVRYDGEPEFTRVEGTDVLYAVNADKTVLKIGNHYYMVDQGVWFDAPTPRGTWQVSVQVPDAVTEIPPSSPAYHVRYVYVYDYTPDVVYVGYTPGYYCSYVYHGTVIYGTGYYYRPWYRHYYFSRPVTYGFGVHFHPYIGWWGYPVGVSYGWISFGWFPVPVAYWGPAGYLYGYRHGYHHRSSHSYYHGYRNGYRRGYSAGRTAGYRAASHDIRKRPRHSANLYSHRRHVVERSGPLPSRRGHLSRSRLDRLKNRSRMSPADVKQTTIDSAGRPKSPSSFSSKRRSRTIHRSPIDRRPTRSLSPKMRTPSRRTVHTRPKSIQPNQNKRKQPTRTVRPPTKRSVTRDSNQSRTVRTQSGTRQSPRVSKPRTSKRRSSPQVTVPKRKYNNTKEKKNQPQRRSVTRPRVRKSTKRNVPAIRRAPKQPSQSRPAPSRSPRPSRRRSNKDKD